MRLKESCHRQRYHTTKINTILYCSLCDKGRYSAVLEGVAILIQALSSDVAVVVASITDLERFASRSLLPLRNDDNLFILERISEILDVAIL